MHRPLVSVIIPAYNAAPYIIQTVQSVFEQTYPVVEIIVVDDGSTDDTAAIAEGIRGGVTVRRQPNLGVSAARNHGIEVSRGELLCFLDADDLMAPDRLSRQLGVLVENQQVGLVFSNYRNFSADGPAPQTHFESCPSLLAELGGRDVTILERPCVSLALENFGIAGSPLVRRSVIDAHDIRFDRSLSGSEDFHWYYRVAKHTAVAVLSSVGLLRRLHGNNLSSRGERMTLNVWRAYVLLRDEEDDPYARVALNHFICELRCDLARRYANSGRYRMAFMAYQKALPGSQSWGNVKRATIGLLRTAAMACHLHRPDEAQK
jgi:glycosyltransferase involved in cell wall biosynthesis